MREEMKWRDKTRRREKKVKGKIDKRRKEEVNGEIETWRMVDKGLKGKIETRRMAGEKIWRHKNKVREGGGWRCRNKEDGGDWRDA